MGGDQTLRSITIDPEAIDPEDVELLQEMIQAAVNEGLRALARARRARRWAT